MKTLNVLLSLFFIVLLLVGCSFVPLTKEVQMVKPSDVIITEERTISGFTGIDFSTFGKVILSQGDSESITITGSDNVVPFVETSVVNGTLIIKMEDGVNILGKETENILNFNISVKDLTQLTNSGACMITMNTLSTTDLDVTMSGAGQMVLKQLTADFININISGVGGVEMAGETSTAKIDISGAGNVKAPDLKIGTVDITVSGIGGVELWVTDQLNGNISSVGVVSYYGNPRVNTETTSVGNFESLGYKQ